MYGKVDREELDSLTAIQELIEIPVSGGSVPVFQIISEKRSSNSGMIINFHGGGFMKGRQDKDRVFCSRMAEKFNALVWDVDYSLAPENPFPKAVDEAYQVVKYAFEHSKELEVDTNRIFLIGHSAGGNLAVTVCMKAGEAAKNPYVSPLFAEEEQLRGFPETLIMSAGLDSLCFEDEEFAMKLSRAGVPVTCKRFTKSHHGFTINRTDEWEESLSLIEKFMERLV